MLSPLLYLEAGQGKGQSFHSAKEQAVCMVSYLVLNLVLWAFQKLNL